jgi:hypothetical protein
MSHCFLLSYLFSHESYESKFLKVTDLSINNGYEAFRIQVNKTKGSA